MLPLEELPPDLRGEIERAGHARGLSGWPVVGAGGLDLGPSLSRLARRIEDLKVRAETMNGRLREEMRYGDASDPGTLDGGLLGEADRLERIETALRVLKAAPAQP